jgi:hypothetical protein
VTYHAMHIPLRWVLILSCVVACELSSDRGDGADIEDLSEASEGPSSEPGAPAEPGAEAEASAASDSRGATPSRPGAESPDSRSARPRERPAKPAPEPGAVVQPDLRLEVAEPDRAVSFRQQIVIDESCEVRDGCAEETGLRSLMSVEFTLRNDGPGALELGSPWDSEMYSYSACDQAYIPELFLAELRDDAGEVVARNRLATKCIETTNGSYDCHGQGIGVGERSKQPEGACDFVDITDLEAGDYMLRITVNPEQLLDESDYDNNEVELPVQLEAAVAEDCGHIECGRTCCPVGASCDNGECSFPDLRPVYEAARDTVAIAYTSFGQDSCELEEQCVGGAGRRRLLRFEGRMENYGPGDLDLGPQEGNPLFTYSSCHGHYHTENFASYRLLHGDGSVAAEGHKQGYCLSDMVRISDPSAAARERPPPGRTTPCNRLTAGWADIYDTDTPCQWIDITDLAAGEYTLEFVVNPDGHIAETDTDNNTVLVSVYVPPSNECSRGDASCPPFGGF